MAATAQIKVWDPLVRTIHWSVAALILIELLNEAGANPWHRYLGYVAAALVVARLAWGCGNRGHASLSSMANTGMQALAYFDRPGSPLAGHTPPGALMAFTLWGLVLLVALTGWMQGLDAFWGEEWLQHLHEILAYTLAACAALHIAAAIVTSYVRRMNLVKSMLTGVKPMQGGG